MAHTRCETCKGRKVVMGLGYMTAKCRTCNGVGHVAVVEDLPVDEAVITACTVPNAEPVKRKYVRKLDRSVNERVKD